MQQTILIAFGAGLALIGAVLMAFTLSGLSGDRLAPPQGADMRTTGSPSRVLPIAGGLCLAAGAGLIGIGANGWYVARKRMRRSDMK